MSKSDDLLAICSQSNLGSDFRAMPFPPNAPFLRRFSGLQQAAADGDLAEVTRLLIDGANVNVLSGANGHYAVVEYLLSQGASVDLPNRNPPIIPISRLPRSPLPPPAEYTALMAAAREGHVAILQLLVDNGADLEVARNNGK
nr:ankyrin repeat domain-containing protein 50-like [Penaeus vannamei]